MSTRGYFFFPIPSRPQSCNAQSRIQKFRNGDQHRLCSQGNPRRERNQAHEPRGARNGKGRRPLRLRPARPRRWAGRSASRRLRRRVPARYLRHSHPTQVCQPGPSRSQCFRLDHFCPFPHQRPDPQHCRPKHRRRFCVRLRRPRSVARRHVVRGLSRCRLALRLLD